MLEALEEMAERKNEGRSKALAIPVWETKLMLQMQLTEEQYIKIPKPERARKLTGMQLSDWLSSLEMDLDEQLRKK